MSSVKNPVPSIENTVAQPVVLGPVLVVNPPTQPTASGRAEVALSTAETILAVLKEVGEMTQNIPYIKAISGVCIHILKMKAEVDEYRDGWKAVMKNIEAIKDIIEEYHMELTSVGATVMPEDIKKAFKSLEQYLQATVTTWARYQPATKSSSMLDHISLFLRRTKLNAAIKNCARDTEIALQIFNTKISLGTRTDAAKILDALNKVRIVAIEDTVTPPDLRAPSATMFGRNHEIQELVTSIQQKAPARIAILGPGGIGKTSLSLAVLHHPAIASEFIDARYLVPCDAARSADALLLEMAAALGIFTDGILSLEKKILAFLHRSKCILCLDNFETPWDAQTELVEELLAKITSIPSVSVLVTMRGRGRPAKTLWTQPFLPPVMPLTLEAALQTFEAISGKRDAYATTLVQAVECVPLAVQLLAYLAQSEDTVHVWENWETKHTSMAHRRGIDKLSSVDFSIMLSLESPQMTADPDALVLLSILSMLPDGLQMSKLQSFQTAFANLPYMQHALSTLYHNALVYTAQSGNISVLSPIRLYIQANHALSLESIDGLKRYYLPLASLGEKYALPDVQTELLPEIGNLNFLLESFFEIATPDNAIVKPTLDFCRFCQFMNLYEDKLLNLVYTALQDPDHGLRGDCLFLQAKCCQFTAQIEKAEGYYKEALTMHEKAEDLSQQAHDLQYLGKLYFQLSRLLESEHNLQRALKLHTKIGDKVGQGYDLQNLGRISLELARFSEARDHLHEAQCLHAETNAVLGQAYNFELLGTIHMQLAEYKEAKEVTMQSLEMHVQVRDVLGQANTTQLLGRINLLLGDLQEAKANFKSAVFLHEEACDSVGQANDLHCLGDIHIRLNQPELAKDDFNKALALHKQENDIMGQANDYQELAALYTRYHADAETSKEMLEKAISLHIQAEDQLGEAADLLSLGTIDMKLGRCLEAVQKFEKAEKISKACQDKKGLANALLKLGTVHIELGDHEKALKCLNNALEWYNETGGTLGSGNVMQIIGILFLKESRFDLAIDNLEKALACHSSIQANTIPEQAVDSYYLGEAFRYTSQILRAREMYEESAKLYEKCKNISGMGDSFFGIAQTYMHREHMDLVQAETFLERASQAHAQAKKLYEQGRDLKILSLIHTALNQHDKAEKELHDALGIFKELGSLNDALNACRALEQLYQTMSREEDAQVMSKQAVDIENQLNTSTQ
ncbi:TPR-like protein [Dentipellis sp. KUC8613]|nr:TPR-like protein [Dentipellis sp. KUC8613]